jgi:ribosomal protein S18 acetylase RimI-like enzyme
VAGGDERSWSIRQATAADADVISEILVAAGRVAWGPFLGESRVEEANRGRMHPADLVAIDEEGVLAFVAWNLTTGEIERLYTHPRGWRRGAGRALLERAVEALRAAGLEQAWLVTEERNEGARRFYERVGWREDGPVRVREWQGVRLREPRYVKDL